MKKKKHCKQELNRKRNVNIKNKIKIYKTQWEKGRHTQEVTQNKNATREWEGDRQHTRSHVLSMRCTPLWKAIPREALRKPWQFSSRFWAPNLSPLSFSSSCWAARFRLRGKESVTHHLQLVPRRWAGGASDTYVLSILWMPSWNWMPREEFLIPWHDVSMLSAVCLSMASFSSSCWAALFSLSAGMRVGAGEYDRSVGVDMGAQVMQGKQKGMEYTRSWGMRVVKGCKIRHRRGTRGQTDEKHNITLYGQTWHWAGSWNVRQWQQNQEQTLSVRVVGH